MHSSSRRWGEAVIGVLFATILTAQAALPPPGMQYFSRTEYRGPGLVCGAAFSIELRQGERAILTKSSAIDAAMNFHVHEGQFSVRESQYATGGGKVVKKVSGGVVRRKRHNGQLTFIYRDTAPGSTDIFGPALNGTNRETVLRRIVFGGPRYGSVGGKPCMVGTSFGEKST